MALQYGMNIPASNIKGMLEKNDIQQSGVRTWRQLLGGASQNFAAQSAALTTDYSEAISQAYKANLEQMDALAGSNLSAGADAKLAQLNREELAATYQKYVQGYAQNVSALTEDYATEVGAIEGALTERAENYSNLFNQAYKYLSEELSLADFTREDIDSPIYSEGKSPELQGYETKTTDYLSDYNLDWMRDEAGELLAWDDLAQKMFNEDGSLNQQGIAFYDAMFNATPQGYMSREDGTEIRSFDKWLSDSSPELRDWLVSQDVFNYNFAGTNRGTANLMTGRKATDMTYEKSDYLTSDDFKSIDKNSLNVVNADFSKILKDWHSMEHMSQGGGTNILTPIAQSIERKRVSNNFNKYRKQIVTQLDNTDTEYKKILGSSNYEQLRNEHKDVFDNYDKLMKDFQAAGNPRSAEKIANELQIAAQQIYSLVTSFKKDQ